MSQAVTVIPNTGTLSGLTLVNDVNAALDCLLTNNSGATAPAQTPIAYQFWADTTKKNLAMYLGSTWVPKININDYTYQAKTANYTVVAVDFGTQIDATANTWTLTLTAVATLGDGFWFDFVNSGTGIVTIDPNASETIDGATSILVYPGQSFRIACSGTAWRTIGRPDSSAVWPLVTKTGAYTVVGGDLGSMIQATANTWTLTLTAAATLGNGFLFGIQNIGAGIVTIDPNSAETINGAATLAVNPGETRLVICDGSNFRTISSDGINSLNRPVASKTASYTVLTSDRGALLRFSGLGSNATVTLPAAATAGNGFMLSIVNDMNTAVGSTLFTLTIDPNGAELLDGLSTRVLGEGNKVDIVSDGTGWRTACGKYGYFSGDQSITAGGNLTLPHGLGRRPKNVWAELRCVTAQGNYVTNDICTINIGGDSDTGAMIGCAASPDSTNLNVVFASFTQVFVIPNKTTGAPTNITIANWRARFYAEE